MGEQPIFGEQVVAHQRAPADGVGDHAVLLPIAAEQEEDLGLERIAGAVGVEVTEERILFEDLQQQLSGQAFAEEARQRGLADADRTFDGDVGVSGHGMAPCGAMMCYYTPIRPALKLPGRDHRCNETFRALMRKNK